MVLDVDTEAYRAAVAAPFVSRGHESSSSSSSSFGIALNGRRLSTDAVEEKAALDRAVVESPPLVGFSAHRLADRGGSSQKGDRMAAHPAERFARAPRTAPRRPRASPRREDWSRRIQADPAERGPGHPAVRATRLTPAARALSAVRSTDRGLTSLANTRGPSVRRSARASPRKRSIARRSASSWLAQRSKPKRRATQPGRHALRPGRRLDGDCPGAAHRIDQRPLPVPPGETKHRCGQRLAQGSRTGVRPPAAFVERSPAHVEVERRLVPREVKGQEQVGIVSVDGGARAEPIAERVDHGVLRLLRHELRVRQLTRAARGTHRQRRPGRHPRRPVDGPRSVVEGIPVACFEGGDLEQDPHGHARPETGARSVRHFPLEVHASPVGPHAPEP